MEREGVLGGRLSPIIKKQVIIIHALTNSDILNGLDIMWFYCVEAGTLRHANPADEPSTE